MNEPVSASTPRQSALFATSGPLAGRLGAAFFASLPAGPGVYRFDGEDDRLRYIGQSSNLRARVGSYRFVNGASHSRRIVRMVARVFRAAWEECPSAAEAIALESRLLLEHSPPFNRAGVWQPPPWWLILSAAENSLRVKLCREDETENAPALGPLPSGFRYTFAALMRCLYRWQWPAVAWWGLPHGMARATIAPAQEIALPADSADLVPALRAFITSGSPETLAALTAGIAALPPESQEGMFWTADADTLQQHCDASIGRQRIG